MKKGRDGGETSATSHTRTILSSEKMSNQLKKIKSKKRKKNPTITKKNQKRETQRKN